MRNLRERLLKRLWGRWLLASLSLLYFCVLAARRFWYRITAHHGRRIPGAYVLSVGNLTAGGTGKTSMSAYLSESILKNPGSVVCVISRGYKGGDEARMLEREFQAHADRFHLRVSPDRYRSAFSFIQSPGASGRPVFFILDDAHQHFSLQKNRSLVLINCLETKDLSALLPLGLLREPMRWGLERADAVVLTYADLASPAVQAFLKSQIDALRPGLPVFRASHEPASLVIGEKERPPEELEGKTAVLVSGIGRPEAFEQTVSKKLKAEVARHFVFEDHHSYSEKEWDEIKKFAAGRALPIVTTLKDLIRFPKKAFEPGNPELLGLRIRLKILDAEPKFLAALGLEQSGCA